MASSLISNSLHISFDSVLVPKRKTQKRKRKLILSPDDEIADSETATAEPAVGGSFEERENEPVVESTTEVLRTMSADDVDFIIQQVVTETAQLETDEGELVDEPDVTISATIDALRESFSNFAANQSRDSRQTNNALGEVMNKIDHVKRVFLNSIAEKNETIRGLFKRSRQEAQNDNNALSLALKAVRTQNVILSTDLEATRKEVKDIKTALSKDFDDKLADIRNELLKFRIETQGQLASLSTHLAELIAFLTKGSDDKKGEDSSSRRPQPPPDNQSRPSGGNGGSGNRAEEQSRYSGGKSCSRGDMSGSSKRRFSSSGGRPFRRSFEDWLG
ncbi:hypothetical protein F511_36624 [Dorcoceras hygrometricum]|uniref:Uncharacterized protein n=1 Tax=Dorcoceras hygrometricum TaxID=472368 RepID=A0A2Z7BQ88_9LAMI|nr:hypothetical protein F511_36624 [Dorcoceras hygrometricum]